MLGARIAASAAPPPPCRSASKRDQQRDAGTLLRRVAAPVGVVLGGARQALAEGAPMRFSTNLQYPGSADLQAATTDLAASVSSATGSDVFADNPWLLPVGAALLIGVPVLVALANAAGGGGGVQALSASQALARLEAEEEGSLLDIRSREERGEAGSPSLGAVRRAILSVPYTKVVEGELVVEEDFAKRVGRSRGVSPTATLVLLDSEGREAPRAAQALQGLAGKLLYVKGGAEGAQGWRASELPWKEPLRFPLGLPSLPQLGSLKDLPDALDNLADDLKAQPTGGKIALATGAIIAGAVVAFQEVGTLLEVVGLLAAGNFAFKRLVFADKRQELASNLKELVDKKIAVKEVGADVSKIASTLLDTEQVAERRTLAKAKQASSSFKEDLSKIGKELVAAEQEAEKVIVSKLPPIEENGGRAPAAPAANGASTPAGQPKAEAREWIDQWKAKDKTAA